MVNVSGGGSHVFEDGGPLGGTKGDAPPALPGLQRYLRRPKVAESDLVGSGFVGESRGMAGRREEETCSVVRKRVSLQVIASQNDEDPGCSLANYKSASKVM